MRARILCIATRPGGSTPGSFSRPKSFNKEKQGTIGGP
jgi:hypothetical protein